ncbi:MAG: hypothetical protein SPL31_04940, partial [Succinivibrio sp.]|nr:hypothetical protein [Succinivibrio sp.]
SSLELWMLSEASRLLLKLKSTDEYCYILFSAFNKFAEEPIISTQKMNRKAILVMALSFSFGLSVELVPEILSKFPQEISTLFSSGITTGGIVAILSNMLIRIKE